MRSKNYGINVRVTEQEKQKLLEERVPALAENTWNREKLSDFAEFSTRYTRVTGLYECFRTRQGQ